MNDGMMTAGPSNDEYETPPWLWRALDTEFVFTLDGAARLDPTTVLVGKERRELRLERPNALCTKASTKEEPLLWNGERVFCNPPYSNIDPFVHRALCGQATLCVLVLPTTTDNCWFEYLRWARDRGRVEFRYFRRRIRFCLDGKETESPRFTSLIAVVRGL